MKPKKKGDITQTTQTCSSAGNRGPQGADVKRMVWHHTSDSEYTERLSPALVHTHNHNDTHTHSTTPANTHIGPEGPVFV